MGIKKNDIHNTASTSILKKYNLLINGLYKEYDYLNIDKDEFNSLVLNIIELSKKEYDDEDIYSIYLKNKIHIKLKKYIANAFKNDENATKIILEFIKQKFAGPKSDDYILFYLTKLDDFLGSLDYLPNPDMLLKILNNSPLLRRVIDIYVKNKLYNKGIFTNSSIVNLFVDTYCDIYQIDKVEPGEVEETESNDDINKEMSIDAVRVYLNEIKDIPPLTLKEEEKYGYELLNGSEEARNALIEHNLKLVVLIAKRYIGCGVPFKDLIQDGNEGLIAATNKFDIRKGFRFPTYANWWIKLYIIKGITMNKLVVRTPYGGYERLAMYTHKFDELTNELGRYPTDKEVANRMNISTDRLNYIKGYDYKVVSLSSYNIYEDKREKLIDGIPSDDELVEETITISNLSEKVRTLLTKCNLTDREINVIYLRYGLDGKGQKTLEEVRKLLGNISRERVGRIEAKALKKLRTFSNIKEFAIYMDNPDRAARIIDLYIKEYNASDLNTYKINPLDDSDKHRNVVKDRVKKK